MIVAIWIIAICELIRIMQNSFQLVMMRTSRKEQRNLNNEFIDSLKKDNKDWVKELLEEFEKEDNT